MMRTRTTRLRLCDVCVLLFCAAILCSTFGAVGDSGRGRAKEAVCLANLHKWGGIFQAYLDDHNGYFMEGFTGDADWRPNRWIKALGPYYEYDTHLTCCPVASEPLVGLDGLWSTSIEYSKLAWGYSFVSNWPKPMKGSYGINGWCNNPMPGREPYGKSREWHWRTLQVTSAAAIPVFCGAQRYNMWPHHNDSPPVYSGQAWSDINQMQRACLNRHAGTIGCLFMDWSARKVGLKELWTLKWHRKFDTSGPWTKAGGVTRSDWPQWMGEFTEY